MPLRQLYLAALFLPTIGTTQWQSQATPTAATNVIYTTGFERTEGYDDQFTVSGQNGWVIFPTNALSNGLLTNVFEGYGQQAFLGFGAPPGTNEFVTIWQPINFVPDKTVQPVVKFSVLMAITPSTANTNNDSFRWSAYDTNAVRYFSLEFRTSNYQVFYALDDTAGLVSTGTFFTNNSLYELVITMNFARNLWNASLNNMVVVNAKPITTQGTPMHLGDIDAVWAIRNPGFPGDNYMIFDDYRLTAEVGTSTAPTLEVISRLENGQFLLRLYGEPQVRYSIDATSNFIDWTPVRTNSSPDGVFEFLDTSAANFDYRFYRGREADF
jgi:hypothetical protein